MKIRIPERYSSHFEESMYIGRWRDHSLLLLGDKEYDRIAVSFEKLKTQTNRTGWQFVRLLKAGFLEVSILGGEMDVPEGLAGWFQGEERTYEVVPSGLLIR